MAKEGASGDQGLLDGQDLLEGDESENWTRANILLDTVEEMELIGPSLAPTDLLVTLTADCQFCGTHYVLDPATLGFEAEGADDPLK